MRVFRVIPTGLHLTAGFAGVCSADTDRVDATQFGAPSMAELWVLDPLVAVECEQVVEKSFHLPSNSKSLSNSGIHLRGTLRNESTGLPEANSENQVLC